eukprot:UN17605
MLKKIYFKHTTKKGEKFIIKSKWFKHLLNYKY